MHRLPHGFALSIAASVTILVGLSACTGDEEPELSLASNARPYQTVLPVPSSTPAPTADAATGRQRRRSGDEALETSFASRLPDDPNTVVFQYARVGDSPWEPEILSSMTPSLSLQANGHGVFPQRGGPSELGWYQTLVTPTLVLDFVQLLADDIDVFDLAEKHSIETPVFETNPDGTAAGTGPVAVVYVHDGHDDVQFVIPERVLADPKLAGDDAQRVEQLREVLDWLDVWRSVVAREDLTTYAPLGRDKLGWWSDIQQPYTPDGAVAHGTRARSRVRADALIATWAVTTPLGGHLEAPYGATPVEIDLAFPAELALLAEAEARDNASNRYDGAGFWGPLWTDFHDTTRYLVGIRADVPGGNHVIVDYVYVVPKRGLGLR